MFVDFHSHTYESDGSLSPQALADAMRERGVEVYSITDHDTLSAYGQFEPGGGARVVTGIEINTTYRGNEVHVLGYRLDPSHPRLTAMLERNRNARRERVERMVTQLRTAGYGITIEAVRSEGEHAKALGRPHVAKALIRAGMAPDVDWAFRNLLRAGRPGYVPSVHVTPDEVIRTIAEAGGISVLAHPGRLKDRRVIDTLVEHGLHGIEVFYPAHDADDVAAFRALAARHGLVTTAGSDFHDILYHTRGVGAEVAADDIRPFLDLVA